MVHEWRTVNGLIVPVKPMTQQEVMEMYYKLHCRCPSCGDSSIETTCVGHIFHDLDTAQDTNRATCECGWQGIVHDMAPRDADGDDASDTCFKQGERANDNNMRFYRTRRGRVMSCPYSAGTDQAKWWNEGYRYRDMVNDG